MQSNCNCNWKSEADVIVIIIAKCNCPHSTGNGDPVKDLLSRPASVIGKVLVHAVSNDAMKFAVSVE